MSRQGYIVIKNIKWSEGKEVVANLKLLPVFAKFLKVARGNERTSIFQKYEEI
jgi:hypothetical protein